MPTKVQTLKGDFTFPKVGWPKVEYPDTTTGLIRDYRAEDLAVGPLTEWIDRVSGAKLINDTASTIFVPPAVKFENNMKSVVFSGSSRVQESFALPPSVSIAVVYHIDPIGNTNAQRMISGADGFRYFAPNLNSMTYQAATAHEGGRTTVGTLTSEGLIRDQWQAAVLSHENAKTMSAKILGNKLATTSVLAVPAPVVQGRFILGYNSGSAATGNPAAFFGKIARVMVWNRALSPVDMDSVLVQNKKLYSLL